VAAATERILLGTGVLLLPYHQPVVLAKRLTTIDLLSKGRMRLLPIGVGALPGEAAAVAARRAGLRGDGYFPGGRLTAAERASQIELMRTTARDAGRDPAALEITRFGAIDMTAEDVAQHAAQGVDRLVVGPASAEVAEQRDQLSALAERVGLR
jgi:alkanesulfonate monooxygenase SsuD/methylene tetrahydromethanopterin reductase-like flavin-dependent oxidoreductase (luciferase family)